MRHDWQINPDWPSDYTGITAYFSGHKATFRNKTLFNIDGWRFFLGGEGDCRLVEFVSGSTLVILGEELYLVDPRLRRVTIPRSSPMQLSRVCYIEHLDIVIAEKDYGSGIVAIDSNGIRWLATKYYVNDIKVFEVRGDELLIESEHDGWKGSFTLRLDLATGREVEFRPK